MTSSKSTELEPVNKARSLSLTEEPDKRDQQIAILQEDLAKAKDDRLEERYWLAFVIVFLIDCLVFPNLGWVTSLALLLVQFVPAIYFAKKLGIDEVAILLDKLSGLLSDRFKL